VLEVPIAYRSASAARSERDADGLRFLTTIVWTTLTYNPVRILGVIGLGGVGVAALIGLALAAMRLSV